MHQDMYVKALALYLLTYVTAAYQPLNFSEMKPDTGGGSTSFIALPVDGNVYPFGYYTVNITIGTHNPPHSHILDIDTGSDITWVKCAGPNVQPPYYDAQVEPGRMNVLCNDPECIALGAYGNSNCGQDSDDPCGYNVNYADGGSSNGVLFKDSFPFILSNGTTVTPQLAFGCGYPQDNEQEHSIHQQPNEGVLGLGKGASGILKQLSKPDVNVVRDVVGHCLSSTGGGFIFLGSYNLPSNIVWRQLVGVSEHYSLGSANLLFDGNKLIAKGLQIIFDSGSTYTYFNADSYRRAAYWINGKLQGLPGRPVSLDRVDKTLPICWKGPQPFGSISDAAKYFPNLILSFAPNVQFYLSPKHYLIISVAGNACLGILNGTQVGLGDLNVIGDISMQDKLVAYDNENAMVGWAGVPSCSWT